MRSARLERLKTRFALAVDFGDAPDRFAGIGPGNYQTTLADSFRLSTDAAASNSTGPAADGEVEDYVATITARSDGVAEGAQGKKIAHALNGWPTLSDDDLFGRSVASLGDLVGLARAF